MGFRIAEEAVHVPVRKALPFLKFIGNSILMPVGESRFNHNVAWLIGSRSEHDIELDTPQLEWERELLVSRIKEVVVIVSALECQIWNEVNKVASVEAGHGVWSETDGSGFASNGLLDCMSGANERGEPIVHNSIPIEIFYFSRQDLRIRLHFKNNVDLPMLSKTIWLYKYYTNAI